MKRRLTLTLLMLLAFASARAQYWNSLETYRLNKMQPHDRIVPEGDWVRSLDGMWAFAYFDSPKALHTPLSAIRFKDSIRVPGNMELQGYGVPVYVNTEDI